MIQILEMRKLLHWRVFLVYPFLNIGSWIYIQTHNINIP